jgi:Sulfotransferase domain
MPSARRIAADASRPMRRRWRARRARDWPVGPPDFVGVGAQRCGTTWWWRLLCDHPRIEVPQAKELHFFDSYFGREFTATDVDAYHQLFHRRAGSLIGEWTPRYMHDFWTAPLLHAAAPDTKLLVLLRDPMARYRSGLRHELPKIRRSLRRRRRRLVGALDANDALSRSLYHRQLERLLEHFDRGQLLVLQYERCTEDPGGELRRTYEFLGVDPADHVPPFLTESVGRSPRPRAQATDAATAAAHEIVRRDASDLKALVPDLDLELWPSCRGA